VPVLSAALITGYSSPDAQIGSNTMGCTWLKSRREALGIKQEVLARQIDTYQEAVRRWENCHKDGKPDVPYAALANHLNASAAELAADHARDLQQKADAAGDEDDRDFWSARAAAAARKAEQLRRERCFPPIDLAPIEAALTACPGLGAKLAAATGGPGLHGKSAQAAHIAERLGGGDLPGLIDWINTPLQQAIDAAAGLADLDALHDFVLVIGRSAAARQPDLAPGACDHYDAETRAWAYRALIDACRGRDGLKLVRPDPSDPQYRLDDSREHTRAIRCGPVADGEGGEDNRVGELLNEFRLELGLAKGPPPAAESAAFAAYCRDYVNSAVAMHNGFDSYVIGLWERADREAPAVKDRLLALLPSLFLFDCGNPQSGRSALRVDASLLESWLAWFKGAIDGRQRHLDAARPAAAPAAIPSEQKPMTKPMTKPGPSHTYNIHAQNVSLASGDQGTSVQASDQAQVQLNQAALADQIKPLIDELLRLTAADIAAYQDLRRAARGIQGELDDGGSVSEQGRGLLKRAAEALPAADKAVGIVTKIMDLVCRVPGLGA
jgi:transcriptional regulator with XRE-family HTH domain